MPFSIEILAMRQLAVMNRNSPKKRGDAMVMPKALSKRGWAQFVFAPEDGTRHFY